MVSHDKPPKVVVQGGPDWVPPADRSQTGAIITNRDHVAKFVDREGRIVEENTPVSRRKLGAREPSPPEVSESLSEPPGLTVAVDASTQPHRSADTEKLTEPPFVDSPRDVPTNVPREPTTMLDAPTTKVDSAESKAAPTDDAFDRVEWSADRLAEIADALRVDRRRRTADLIAGAHAAMCVGPVRGSLQRVASRLVQQALLADADVGELDDLTLAKLLFELATEVLVGVEPTRVASRTLATQLEERARKIQTALAGAEARHDADAVAEHRGRLDELTSTVRALRRATR